MNEMSDDHLISYALSMWANYIETGDTSLSATDVQQGVGGTINALTTEQMRHIVRLRDLSYKFLLQDGKV